LWGGWEFINAKRTLENVLIEGLKSIADLKAKGIEDFFIGLKKDISAVKEHPNIEKGLLILADFVGDLSNPVYRKIRNELDRSLRLKQKVYQYLNVILLNPEGKIIYVLHLHKSHPMENLGNEIPSPGNKAFKEGKKGIYFSDIFIKKSDKATQYNMLVTAPVLDSKNKFTGVIAFEVDMAPVYLFIRDTTGLGKTG